MVAALAAVDAGASALVLEKQALLGGSTCMSGGIMWVPDNPVMRAAGAKDSYADAMTHFEAVVGDVGPASSTARRHAFLTEGAAMVSFLQDQGVQFVYCPGYSDYYSDAPGGHDIGRGIEPVPYDGHALGPWLAQLQPGLAKSIGLAVKTNESRALGHYNRSVGAFTVAARVVLRTAAARLRGQDLDELLDQDRGGVGGDHPATVDVHHPGGPVLHGRRELLVEDVLGQRDVVVGREHLGARRQAHIGEGTGKPVLGGPHALGRIRHGLRGHVCVPPGRLRSATLLRLRSNRQRTLLRSGRFGRRPRGENGP